MSTRSRRGRLAKYSVSSGLRARNQKLALVEPHLGSRRYADCGSFTHGIRWKSTCCSLVLFSRNAERTPCGRKEIPRTFKPCCVAGNTGFPRHTTALASLLQQLGSWPPPLGSDPPLFHTCVFPWCKWVRHGATTPPQRHAPHLHVLSHVQSRLHDNQRSVLSQCVQHGHEGIPLLPSLPLWNALRDTHLVFPQICGWAAVKTSQKGEDLISSLHPEKASSIALREIRSYAPAPSIDMTVASGSGSAKYERRTHILPWS